MSAIKLLQLETKYRDVMDECHIFRRQVKQLQEELESKEQGLNSYNPNSTEALQRKISKLFQIW